MLGRTQYINFRSVIVIRFGKVLVVFDVLIFSCFFFLSKCICGSWCLGLSHFLDKSFYICFYSVYHYIMPFASVGLQYEPLHEISNNVVCATSKASDQPAHTRSLIRAFGARLNIL